MRLNPFGARSTTDSPDATPGSTVAARARAAWARESTEARRAAKRSGAAARDAIMRTVQQNERDLDLTLDTVAQFDAVTTVLLAAELDAADPITQWSALGRAPVADAGLPGWLRERCLADDAERVVRDWLTFRDLFAAYKEFSARPADDPLPQVYEAMSLQPGESIAVEGVATVGRDRCGRILRVTFALRAAQRATATRDIRSLTGYAAADAWRAFDRSNRFVTADLAEWIVTDDPSDDRVAAEITAGRFSTDEFTAAGRSTGITPHELDAAALVADLQRHSAV